MTGTPKHALLAPSKSEIWLNCLAAPSLWAQLPEAPAGFAANEGTLCHTLAQAALAINDIPWTAGMKFMVEGREVEITSDMLNSLQLYVTLVADLRDKLAWSHVEQRLDISGLWYNGTQAPQDVFGTGDFIGCGDEHRIGWNILYVVDLKYGRGHSVQVEENSQLMIYAIGAWYKLLHERPDLASNTKLVTMVIVQPRAGGAPVRTWTVPVGEILAWAHLTLKPAIDWINSGKPTELHAGRHCFFCAAGPVCPALKALKIANAVGALPDWKEEDYV